MDELEIADIVIIIILFLVVVLPAFILMCSVIYGLCTDTPAIECDSSNNFNITTTEGDSSSSFNLTTWAINPVNPASPTFHMFH